MVDHFVARRRTRWERLRDLLRRGAGQGRGSVEELEELTRLYRQASTDLAVAQRDFPGDRVTLLLTQLVSHAHSVIYREAPAPLSDLRRYFLRDLPAAYRAAWPYLLGAAGLFFLPLLASMALVLLFPDDATLVVPPEIIAELRAGRSWFDIPLSDRPEVASFIMTHNIQVSLLALAGGTLAGVGTVLILISNGISIGGIAGAFMLYGLTDRLLGWMPAHSFLELSTVVIAGACGLMLGKAMVWPGLQTRGAALVAAGGRSVKLLVGCLVFLVIAGLLEGFVSPSALGWPWKLAIGAATGVGMYGYLVGVGRAGTEDSGLSRGGAR